MLRKDKVVIKKWYCPYRLMMLYELFKDDKAYYLLVLSQGQDPGHLVLIPFGNEAIFHGPV